MLGTTLAGYTADRPSTDGPDLELLREMVAEFPELPVVAEGRIWSPKEAVAALDAGAWAVCVGSAITRPTLITERYTRALKHRGSSADYAEYRS